MKNGCFTSTETPFFSYIKMEVIILVKIFLDPGHGGTDPGAVGNGLQEKNITLEIAKKIRDILVNEYENVSIRMSRTGDETVSLSKRTADANSWGADYYLSIHVNAGGGTGFESFIYPNVGGKTAQYQNALHDEIIRITGFANRGKKSANFHVLRETRMPAILTENGFIDNSQDAGKLKSSAFLLNIARGHANGLAKAFNLKKKAAAQPAPSKPPSQTSLYKVQLGAFKNRANADDLVKRAKSAGFDAFVQSEGGLYRVQIGAFSDRKNAEALEKEARSKGFDVYIRDSN